MASSPTWSSPVGSPSTIVDEIVRDFPDLVLVLFGRDFKKTAAELGAMDSEARKNVVKRAYRSRSLHVHPDRCKDPRGHDAFVHLGRARDILDDDNLSAVYLNARGDAQQRYESLKNVEQMNQSGGPRGIEFVIFVVIGISVVTAEFLGRMCNNYWKAAAGPVLGANLRSGGLGWLIPPPRAKRERPPDQEPDAEYFAESTQRMWQAAKLLGFFVVVAVACCTVTGLGVWQASKQHDSNSINKQQSSPTLYAGCTMEGVLRRDSACVNAAAAERDRRNLRLRFQKTPTAYAGRPSLAFVEQTNVSSTDAAAAEPNFPPTGLVPVSETMRKDILARMQERTTGTGGGGNTVPAVPHVPSVVYCHMGKKGKKGKDKQKKLPVCSSSVAYLAYTQWRSKQLVEESWQMRKSR